MAGQLIGPQGQPIGQQPVVAHILSIRKEGLTGEDVAAVINHWQNRLGVPAIVLTYEIELIGSVLADGAIEEIPGPDEIRIVDLTALVLANAQLMQVAVMQLEGEVLASLNVLLAEREAKKAALHQAATS